MKIARPLTALLMAGAFLMLSSGESPAAEQERRLSRRASITRFNEAFPGAVQPGPTLRLMRLDDCKFTAICSLDEVLLMVVQSAKRARCQSAAEHMLKAFPTRDAQILPMQPSKDESAVVIAYTATRGVPESHPLYVLYRSHRELDAGDFQLTEWNGRQLAFRVEMKNTDSKKTAPLMEVRVDCTEEKLGHAEFRLVRGKASDEDIRDFILRRMLPEEQRISASSGVPNSINKTQLRKKFNNSDVLLYAPVNDFCIVSKRKVYYAGTLTAVKAALSNKGTPKKPEFPSKNLPWPSTSDKPSKEEETPHVQPPPEATPSGAEEAPTAPPRPQPVTPPPAPVIHLTPAEAMESYLESLRSL